jgi:hypothetical protein
LTWQIGDYRVGLVHPPGDALFWLGASALTGNDGNSSNDGKNLPERKTAGMNSAIIFA